VDPRGTQGIKDVVPEFLLFPDVVQKGLQKLFHFRYFHDLCEVLYRHGYRDKHTLYGLPYDFRLTLDPTYRASMFEELKSVIEEAYALNKKPCVIVGHSLGGLMLKWFLSVSVSQDWIDKYIDKCYFISVPFGGALFALRAVLAGDFYVSIFHKMYYPELQTNSGIVMCMPNQVGFDKHDVLVHVDKPFLHNFTQYEYGQLANNGHLAFQLWRDLYQPHLSDITKKVDVKAHIVNALNVPTPVRYYTKALDKYPYQTVQGRGDGIVNEIHPDWYTSLFDKNKLIHTSIPGTEHTEIISHPIFLRDITKSALELP
jgi:hypothetical protein